MHGTYVASKNVIKLNTQTLTYESLGLGVEGLGAYALAYHQDTLYVGGDLTAAKNLNGDIPVNSIALYDLQAQSWHAMGQGVQSGGLGTLDEGIVYALEYVYNFSGSEGALVVGGGFGKINGVDTAHSIAAWMPAVGWFPLADGVQQIISVTQSLAARVVDIETYFTIIGTSRIVVTGILGDYSGTKAKANLASLRLDLAGLGTEWVYHDVLGQRQGSAGGWETFCLRTVSNQGPVFSSGILYVGGDFNTDQDDPSAPAPGDYLAAITFDLSSNATASPVEQGITQTRPGLEVLGIEPFQDKMYIGGNFTEANGTLCRNITAFPLSSGRPKAGVAWEGLGEGLAGNCDAVNFVGPIFTIFGGYAVGGRFDQVGSRINGPNLALSVAGTSLTPAFFGFEGLTHPGEIHGWMTDSLGQTWFLGAYDLVNDNQGGSLNAAVFSYDGGTNGITEISQLGTAFGIPRVYAGTFWKGQPVLGGNFTSINQTTSARKLATRVNGTWIEMAHVDGGEVRAILNVGDSLLYIGGTFSTVNGIQMDGVAVYDGQKWSPLGQGLGFYKNVYALALDPLTGELAVGGALQTAYQTDGSPLSSAGLVFWDGSQWKSRGEIIATNTFPPSYSQIVNTMAFTPAGELFIGGQFSGIGPVEADRLAMYDPATGWRPIYSGIRGNGCLLSPPSIRTLYLDTINSRLMIGGQFAGAGNTQANGYAVLNLKKQSSAPLIVDTIRQCGITVLIGSQDPVYTNWQWSTGATNTSVTIDGIIMQKDLQKTFTVTADSADCIISDQITLVGGESYLTTPIHDYTYEVENQLDVKFEFTGYGVEEADWDYGDGTLEFYGDPNQIPYMHSYPTTDLYDVSVWAYNAACGSSTTTFQVDLRTTATDPTLDAAFDVFPNPAHTEFTLTIPDVATGTCQLFFHATTGELLWSERITPLTRSHQVRLPQDLGKGIYVLKLQDEAKHSWYRKIMLE